MDGTHPPEEIAPPSPFTLSPMMTVERLVHPEKSRPGKLTGQFTTTFVICVQPLKADPPRLEIFGPKMTSVNFTHPWKAELPMLVNVSGKEKGSRAVHPLNVSEPIVVRLDGKETEVIF